VSFSRSASSHLRPSKSKRFPSPRRRRFRSPIPHPTSPNRSSWRTSTYPKPICPTSTRSFSEFARICGRYMAYAVAGSAWKTPGRSARSS
jgi:hypothetical protein